MVFGAQASSLLLRRTPKKQAEARAPGQESGYTARDNAIIHPAVGKYLLPINTH
jgi:hypothetical protein